MSNYYYNGSELYHHGVKGMKWGRRKASYDDSTDASKKRRVNRVESKLKAEKKADDARRAAYKSLNNSPKKHSKFEYDVTAEKAAYAARKKSVLADKEHNRQVRADRKAKKDEFRSARRDVGASRSTGSKVATFLLAGPFANRTYNSVRAAGGTKEGAVGMTIAATLLGGPIGNLAVSAYYTHDASRK